MDTSVNKLIKELAPDPWRLKVGFTREMQEFNKKLLDPNKSDAELAECLREWLRKYQPCIFGKIAAGKLNIISFCILRESDLLKDDTWIYEKIKKYRTYWKRQAYRGLKSAFIILAISPKIVGAAPNETLMNLASRICELYLEEEEGDIKPVLPDRVWVASTYSG
jgi:hypothetical protein